MTDKSKKIKEKFLDMMELPKELLQDISRITILGNEDVFIENYRGIIEYEDNTIRLSNNINVFGEKLNIDEITDTDLFITGKINSIEFDG